MYTKLLEETIRELRGEEIEDDARATVNLRVDLKIDENYIEDMNQRLMVYRKVASARTPQELEATIEDIRDRYVPPPDSVLNLAEYGRVRILADLIDIESIDREGRMVVIRFRPNARLDPMRLVKVVGNWPGATLLPPVSVKLDVEAPLAASAPPSRSGPSPRAGGKPSARTQPRSDIAGSWWTARATAGEVRPGFSKEQILRRPESDPRVEGGMFSRLIGLLQALAPEGAVFLERPNVK
jgi:transcription-repair coupling factor (superfamily II helicase)